MDVRCVPVPVPFVTKAPQRLLASARDLTLSLVILLIPPGLRISASSAAPKHTSPIPLPPSYLSIISHHLRLAQLNSPPHPQFFITTVETPFLDNKHVVFGRVLSDGQSMLSVRKIEAVPTGVNDRPKLRVVVVECGEM